MNVTYPSLDNALQGISLSEQLANAVAERQAWQREAQMLLQALERCIDSQECNGYIGVETMTEACAAVAKATGETA